jgi:uncharacterized protein (TIGR02453 family)
MGGAFRGFGPELYEFFEGLTANNDKAWFTEHKQQYETQVREPLEALFSDLEPAFGEAKLFRIHRDVRFSKVKTPYKTAQAGLIHLPGGSTRYMQVNADGVMFGAGVPHMDPGQVARYRAAVAGDAGEQLASAIATLTRAKYVVGTLGPDGITPEGELKRVPRDYPPDHPRGDLLRCKSLIAAISFDRPAWLGSPRAVTEVAKRWTAMQPVISWLDTHVGPAEPRTRAR